MRHAFYRTHRPRSLQEVVGQSHITDTLNNALKAGSIRHAYLFTGPRGVGKTSVARILAHEINQIPYDHESQHLDIVEIDAASNRKIDEMRDLREKVHTLPASAKYKVYIIDEVHMLTKEAFNALLKTLEEPPSHVVFILATTEFHKVPATIISRTQHFRFKIVDSEIVIKHLEMIAKKESLQFDDEALELIANLGEGSLRDSIMLLDQFSGANKKITADTIRQSAGIPSKSQTQQLVSALYDGKITELQDLLNEHRASGLSTTLLADDIIAKIHQDLLNKSCDLDSDSAFRLLKELLQISRFDNSMIGLQVILLSYAISSSTNEPSQVSSSNSSSKQAKVIQTKPLQSEKQITEATSMPASNISNEMYSKGVVDEKNSNNNTDDKKDKPLKDVNPSENLNKSNSTQVNLEGWQQLLTIVKSRHNTLYGALRMATPSFDGSSIKLTFGFNFHIKQLKTTKNTATLTEIVSEMFGEDVTVNFVYDKKIAPDKPTPSLEIQSQTQTPIADDVISNISNIFGGSELLES